MTGACYHNRDARAMTGPAWKATGYRMRLVIVVVEREKGRRVFAGFAALAHRPEVMETQN